MPPHKTPGLTDMQRRMLDALTGYIREHGYPPSIRDLMAPCGLRTTSAVVYQLGQLVAKGFILRAPNRSRAVVVVDVPAVPDVG